MKKFGLLSLVFAGVAFTAVGCASEAGVHASGTTQTAAASPEAPTEAQSGVAVQADTATQTQPVQAAPEAPQTSPEAAPVQ